MKMLVRYVCGALLLPAVLLLVCEFKLLDWAFEQPSDPYWTWYLELLRPKLAGNR